MIRPALTEIGIFLIPFAVYALFLVASDPALSCNPRGPFTWSRNWRSALSAGDREPRDAGEFLRRAAAFDLRSRPYRERQAGARS